MPRPRARLGMLLAAALLLAACGGDEASSPVRDAAAAVDAAVPAGVTVLVHRTEACGCCGRYQDYLEAAGFTVEQEIHEDLADVRARLGVPEDERSCHTNEVAGYAAEGHVPAEALLQLVEEAPDVDGVSLAGMPAGSPGMPGEQEAPFVLRTFVDGEVVGELGRF